MLKIYNNIINNYKDYAVSHWNASKEGDYKTANKYYSKLKKIYKQLMSNEEIRESVLDILLNDSNYAVRLWAASHSLGLGFQKNRAENILQYIAKLSSEKAPSFEAKMTLEVWKEKGKLIF